jgi:hypothetical protein
MNDDSFRRFRCWTIPKVQQTLFPDIASLGLDADAVFLAAHTSRDIEHAQGVQQLDAKREVAVLRALDSSFGLPDANTLIAITGPSGSGKSHLVRWVRAQLPESPASYRLIYVPKALETLRQLLNHILDRMPGPEAEAVKTELDKAVGQKPPQQLGEELLDRLRLILAFELPETKPGHNQELRSYLLGSRPEPAAGREGGLPDLMLIKPIRDHLLRPDGTIARIVNSVQGKRQSDVKTPEFDASDFPIRQSDVLRQLQGPLVPLWSLLLRDPSDAFALLNEARNRAVADALGMRPGINLGEVFSKARRQLRSEGKELVLLFEDLTQFGLFDGDLYDQFTIQPGSDLAPIRALFAITDGKFEENVPPTVRTRLDHHFKVAALTSNEGDLEDQVAKFVARYLNIARIGRQRLVDTRAAADAGDRESGHWIPNACLDPLGDGRECINRDDCWSSFDAVDDIGLYPYDKTALRRRLRRMGERITARRIVEEIVRDFLVEADPIIGRGLFPDEHVRQRFDFTIALDKESIVPKENLEESERDRLHRCRVIWADGRIEKAGITVAFDLPTSEGTTAPPIGDTPVPEPRPTAKPNPLVPLFSWQNGEEMLEAEAVWYRERLFELVLGRVDLLSMLIDPGPGPGQMLLGRVLSANSFELTNSPGQPAGRNRLRFPIEPDDSGVLLLSAVRWWWDHGHWDIDSTERKWDFPSNPASAQLTLDEFLESAARLTEGALVAVLLQGPAEPASAAVALRASALTAVGHGPADADANDSIEWVFNAPSAQSMQPSPSWAPVAAESLSTLNDVGAGWIAAFASAQQGETGEPLCVDAARLLPTAQAAARDPVHALAGERTFDEAFIEISQHWEKLGQSLRSSVEAEARSLTQALETVDGYLSGQDFRELVGAIASAGQLAGDHNVFRPLHQYRAFRDACDRLAATSPEEVARVLGAIPQLLDVDSGRNSVVVMRAQSWAPGVRSMEQDLDLIRSCLQATADELSDRLGEGSSSTPEAAAAELSLEVKRAATILARTFGEREAR